MEEANNKRYAVVTGANRGIGLGICKLLASKGIVVILTARDEKRGLEAVEKLKKFGLSDRLLFHQLDVADAASVASLADFIRTQFGKLDILMNNAAVNGVIVHGDALGGLGFDKIQERFKPGEIMTQTCGLAEECLRINYYGTKNMIEALLPLLQLSDAPKIVNVSSSMGLLQCLKNEWAIGVLGDAENLTEERVDEVCNEFLKDFKQGLIEAKNWPAFFSAYGVSKAVINAYTRILAKKFPNICINCVCPGYVQTDMTLNTGEFSVEEGAEPAVRLALLPKGAPSGCFYARNEKSPF